MGEKQEFQPLTREDKITAALYRAGIVISAVLMCGLAYLLARASSPLDSPALRLPADVFLYGLYISAGISAVFIHLYIGKLKTYLRNLYLISLVCLAVLLVLGKGSLAGALAQGPNRLLLLPLSGCIGFITAKEAFCFRLFEGYLLAMIMPLYVLLAAAAVLGRSGASIGLALIAVLLVFFTARKVAMPLAYDIGDKSAYR
jgi:uncharacterized integral membrane protein